MGSGGYVRGPLPGSWGQLFGDGVQRASPSVPRVRDELPAAGTQGPLSSVSVTDALAPPLSYRGLTPHLHVEAVSEQAESSIFRRNVLHSNDESKSYIKRQRRWRLPFFPVPSLSGPGPAGALRLARCVR